MQRDYQAIRDYLHRLSTDSLYRAVTVAESPQQPERIIDGARLLTFCSNDYLGLANHPDVLQAFKKAADQYGVGSGASHLVNGHTREHHLLEEELADFTGRDKALVFSTGYMANLGVVQRLLERGDSVYEDRLNHASLLDAAVLSRARLVRYPHLDTDRLADKIGKDSTANRMIVSDGVFSMDGDVAPVKELAKLARETAGWLMIDDAHGIGVLGKTGGGLLEQQGMNQDDVPLLIGTFGKALGTAGAFVSGRAEVIEYLKQRARPWIFTTAMPAAIAAATRASLKIASQETWRRSELAGLIALFRKEAGARGLRIMPSATAIQPVLAGSSAEALAISDGLKKRGILVTAIRPPTVPEGTARLRVTLSALHTREMLERLLDALQLECR